MPMQLEMEIKRSNPLFILATRALNEVKEILMEENNTVIEQETTQGAEEKASNQRMFTQDELNQIVSERLAKERSKYADYEDLKAKASNFSKFEEVQKQFADLQVKHDALIKSNEIRDMKDKVSKETGVPISLLTATTEEECMLQAKGILDFAKPSYPSVKDGGEVQGSQKMSVEQQFADWFNQATK